MKRNVAEGPSPRCGGEARDQQSETRRAQRGNLGGEQQRDDRRWPNRAPWRCLVKRGIVADVM